MEAIGFTSDFIFLDIFLLPSGCILTATLFVNQAIKGLPPKAICFSKHGIDTRCKQSMYCYWILITSNGMPASSNGLRTMSVLKLSDITFTKLYFCCASRNHLTMYLISITSSSTIVSNPSLAHCSIGGSNFVVSKTHV